MISIFFFIFIFQNVPTTYSLFISYFLLFFIFNFFPMPMRRRRRRVYANISVKRPLDKQILQRNGYADSNALTAVQNTTVLYQATFPCTVTGIRYDCSLNDPTGTTARGAYLIVILRDGLALPTNLGLGGTATPLFTPEQNVLVARSFGVALGTNPVETQNLVGSTKTMRKLMGGDQLVCLMQCVAPAMGTTQVSYTNIIQFFLKS